MVLAEWILRFGQTMAPDENYKPNLVEEEKTSIMQVIAPDPNYQKRLQEEQNSKRIPPSEAFQQRVQCIHCHKYTPGMVVQQPAKASSEAASTQSNARRLTPTTPGFHTPSPTTPLTQSSDHVNGSEVHLVEHRVLLAVRDTAFDLASPEFAKKSSKDVFRWLASAQPINDKLQKRLERRISADPSICKARSHGMEPLCPDGLTPFLLAAHSNQVAAAKILLQLGPRTEQLQTVNLQGKSAYHLAATRGNLEFLDYIKTVYEDPQNGTLFSSPTPVDLLGRTPLGAALTSPEPQAKRNKQTMMDRLFSPQDMSILGSPAPVTQRTATLSELQLAYGSSHMPGKRIMNEDAILTTKILLSDDSTVGVFGVFDGHSDAGKVSNFIASQIPHALRDAMQQAGDWNSWCRHACLEIDANLKKSNIAGGSTAVFAIITLDQIVVANVGDSRCILVQHDSVSVSNVAEGVERLSISETVYPQTGTETNTLSGAFLVKALSEDHKPEASAEHARIQAAGMTITEERFEEDGEEVVIHKVRLSDGNRMACSRSFGDFEYKANETLEAESQAIVAVPDVVVHERSHADCYLVLACDGIWDVMSSDEVGQFVVEHIKSCGETEGVLPEVGDRLLAECLQRGSGDNLSAVVVALSNSAEHLSSGQVLKGKALDFSGTPP
jgi:serine/threonine protein phosphatase PrpC